MRKSRFTEEQIIGFIKQPDAALQFAPDGHGSGCVSAQTSRLRS